MNSVDESVFMIRSNLLPKTGFDQHLQQQHQATKTILKLNQATNTDLELLDVEDDEDEVNGDNEDDNNRYHLPNHGFSSRKPLAGQPMTNKQATQLKTLMLGPTSIGYPTEWLHQYFDFDDQPQLYYGLIQLKGGPCGVLAALQADILKELFFTVSSSHRFEPRLLASSSSAADHQRRHQQNRLLAVAVANTLTRIATRNRQATVQLVVESQSIVAHRLSTDGIADRIRIIEFKAGDFDALFEQIVDCLDQNRRSLGCLSLAFSCLLTRGLSSVADDFDDRLTSLIDRHNYCSQELVNLMATGRAVSNVFDGTKRCDEFLLRGVDRQPAFGFLSLFEHYKCCQVGAYYKNPANPIWLVLSESHFTVLFAKNRIDGLKTFDLFYFDGLARQEDEIRLTITQSTDEFGPEEPTGQLIPIECVIRTRWPNVRISWNSTAPIL